ncbi:BRO family, N-terminal domain [Terrisporobacter glycolicus]|nr:BRO family, N-terminal domain [Terrisporobacter glycolicus]
MINETQEITVFSNEIFGEVRCVTIEDEPWFVAKDIAKALGYTSLSRMYAHVEKEDKNKIDPQSKQYQGSCGNGLVLESNPNVRNMVIINESGLYDAIFGSRLPEAKKFKRWVTKEVLPELRKTKCVILESATKESIDFNVKYGKFRIRKTFISSKDMRSDYEEFKKLSKNERLSKRLDNKDRIKLSNIIIDTIEEKVANQLTNLRASEVIAAQELVSDIKTDILKLSNKYNGGIKSKMTKQINKLTAENQSLKESEIELDWKLIKNHGFTENCQIEFSKTLNKMVRTKPYNVWRSKFDYSDFRELNCDTTRPMILYLHFGKLDKYDTTNLEKTAIDMISDYYGFNDNLIISKVTTSDTVESCEEGYIYFDLVNLED